MDTSSADPFLLAEYSDASLELLGGLRAKATELTAAVEALAASRSEFVPALGDRHVVLRDLVDDWIALAQFAGDVAAAFLAADQVYGDGPVRRGTVLRLADATLARHGRIGYADRDAAIAAAQAMASELDRLAGNLRPRQLPSDSEVQGLIERARRGQHDSAFALAFSELVGPSGYADAAALIRLAYLEPRHEERIGPLRVLAATMTTALHAQPSGAFRDRLARGLLPSRLDRPPFETLSDLSVVVRFAEPPTATAVLLAQGRLTPALPPDLAVSADHWGPYGSVADNYATMLGHDQDASARWLVGEGNLESVLARGDRFATDEGAALARVVENGVTHPDRGLRHQLMERTIGFVGDQGEAAEIRGRHLHAALAAGVEANMDLVDHVVNDRIGSRESSSGRRARQVHALFTELVGGGSGGRVRDAVLGYVGEEAASLSTDRSDGTLARAEDLGRILGVAAEAEVSAAEQTFAAETAEEDRKQKLVDLVVGVLHPPVGPINGVTDLVFDRSLGDLVAAPPSPSDLSRTRTAIDGELRADIGRAGSNKAVGYALGAGADHVETEIDQAILAEQEVQRQLRHAKYQLADRVHPGSGRVWQWLDE